MVEVLRRRKKLAIRRKEGPGGELGRSRKGTCLKSSLMIKAAVWGQLRQKEEEMVRGKVEGTDVGEQKCSSLM